MTNLCLDGFTWTDDEAQTLKLEESEKNQKMGNMNLEKLTGEGTILDNKNVYFNDWKVKRQDTSRGSSSFNWKQKKKCMDVCAHD